jgi:hypothetical protein
LFGGHARLPLRDHIARNFALEVAGVEMRTSIRVIAVLESWAAIRPGLFIGIEYWDRSNESVSKE